MQYSAPSRTETGIEEDERDASFGFLGRAKTY